MNRWMILGAMIFGGVFALFAFWQIEVPNPRTTRYLIAVFLFGFYCAIVAFGTAEKKRSLSLPAQTVLGFALAIAIAALFQASSEGYAVAAILGVILGFTADKWVESVPLP